MVQLQLQTVAKTKSLTSLRKGETKLGETLLHIIHLDELQNSDANFVIFGIAEDLGVQANFGQAGAKNAWDAFIRAFVNVQESQYNQGKQILLLGCISLEKEPNPNHPEDLGITIEAIDEKVAQLVQHIVASGKIPIGIGGGHNNAFGFLKGSSAALDRKLQVINIDAHTDLRTPDYRHSGNGFSYAIDAGFLKHYTAFGLHKNYTPQYIFDAYSNNPGIDLIFFEDMLLVAEQLRQFKEVLQAHVGQDFGLELDCDAIAHFSSSAQTPSGFTLETIRLLTQLAFRKKGITYLHIAEAAPTNDSKNQIGKALIFIVTDCIRAFGNSSVHI